VVGEGRIWQKSTIIIEKIYLKQDDLKFPPRSSKSENDTEDGNIVVATNSEVFGCLRQILRCGMVPVAHSCEGL